MDERVNLRNEFLRQGLDDVLARVKRLYRLEDEPDLHTQIDVFEDELNSDKDELMDRFEELNVNLENCDDVFFAVKKQVQEAKRGLEHPLLSVMQNLLTVPTTGDAGYVCWCPFMY